ncbi:MAG: transglutaminase-like cysteine peptidase, partial [Hyphomicrobiales bacterium]
RTDRGDLVLDNLDDRVMLWSETPYTYIKRQSKNHTGKWELIKDIRVGSVASISQ